MALISERKAGRVDGAYTRLFGSAELGALISQVHATSISAGTELERLVTDAATIMDAQALGNLLSSNLPAGVFLMPKKLIKEHLKPLLRTSEEPDFLILKVVEGVVFVVELKDGDTFDTKKAAGEVASLRKFASALHGYLLREGVTGPSKQPYITQIRFCCFNQLDKAAIVAGCKHEIRLVEAMTGPEFCALVGISWDEINRIRAADQARNVAYFLGTLAKISMAREVLSKLIRDA